MQAVDGDGGVTDDDVLPIVGEVGFRDGEVGGKDGGLRFTAEAFWQT